MSKPLLDDFLRLSDPLQSWKVIYPLKIAKAVREKGTDYLLALKGNWRCRQKKRRCFSRAMSGIRRNTMKPLTEIMDALNHAVIASAMMCHG